MALNPQAIVMALIAVVTFTATTAIAVDGNEKERNVGQSNFDKYAQEVESLSKNAGPESRAVIANIRIPAGATIEEKWLQVIPLIDYSKTVDSIPQPRLLKRSVDQFGSINEVAGHVALRDIDEQAKITRAQVGQTPGDQFKLDQNSHIRIHYHYRHGAVLPNAPADIHECTLDSAKLSKSEKSDLIDRIVKSNILLEQDSSYTMLAGGVDNYLVEATIGSVTKSVSWSGKNAPGPVWNLIEYLDGHSKKEHFGR